VIAAYSGMASVARRLVSAVSATVRERRKFSVRETKVAIVADLVVAATAENHQRSLANWLHGKDIDATRALASVVKRVRQQ